SSFYPFFKLFIESFLSDSMGDRYFNEILAVFYRQEYAVDYHLILWNEVSELIQSLPGRGDDTSSGSSGSSSSGDEQDDDDDDDDDSLPIDDLGYLFPY